MVCYYQPLAIGMRRRVEVLSPSVMRMIVQLNDRIVSINRYSNVPVRKEARSQKTTGLFFGIRRIKIMEWSLVFHLLGMVLLMVAKQMEDPANRMKN